MVMIENTCAACDCKLDAGRISVKIGGTTVEVCCEECALAVRAAYASAASQQTVLSDVPGSKGN
jgi:hypothetical protein